MNKVTTRLNNALILLIIIIAPSLLGSYYKEWRWPLILSSLLLITLTPPSLLLQKKQIKKHHPSKWFLVIATLTICFTGTFMWHNSWGIFGYDLSIHGQYHDWHIIPLDNQPFHNLPGATDKNEAFDRLSYIIPALFLTLAVSSLITAKLIKLQTICAGIFWTGAGIALLGLTQRFTGAEAILWNENLFNKNQPLFFSTFRSPAIACSYLNISLTIGLAHLLATTNEASKKTSPKPTATLAISIGIITIFSAIVCAGSKAGIAFSAATIILWLLLNIKPNLKFFHQFTSLLPSGSTRERNIIITAILLTFILGTLSFGSTVTKRWESSFKSDHRTLQQRQTANETQIKMIQDPQWSKVAGFGPGSFFPLFHYYKQGTDLKSTWVYAHNDHLQTLVEWGYLGTSCFALIIAGGCYLSLTTGFSKKKHLRTSHKLYLKGITLAITTCLLHATVDFPFQIESIAITIAILLGIAWASPTLGKTPHKRHPASNKQ